MEDSSSNTSTPSLKALRAVQIRRVLLRSVTMVVLGVCIGACIVFIQNSVPYNRIVVFNQPTSTVIRLASVRLKKPGYVVILSEENGGWSQVGMSFYLPAGYHQNLTIDIGIPHLTDPEHKDIALGNFMPHSYVARLYLDRDPQYFFDEFGDELVHDARGNIYQKRFWMDPPGRHIRAFARWFTNNPFGNMLDVLFPY